MIYVTNLSCDGVASRPLAPSQPFGLSFCVPIDDFSDAALVLVAHGSTVNAGSSAPARQHADELRRRKIFAEVRECFWKQEPGVASVVGEVSARRVLIVPLFISEGYFTQEVIPQALGFSDAALAGSARILQRGAQTLCYCAPIGSHPSMTEVVFRRAREVVEKNPFPRAPKPKEISLFVAGHGTGNNENSRKAIERQAELIRAQNLYAAVQAVFLEEDPRIGDCYRLAVTRNIVMVPFFISDGLHSDEDIPEMLGEPRRIVQERLKAGQPTWRNPTEKQGKLVWYSRSIGTEPHIAEVIIERVREAAANVN